MTAVELNSSFAEISAIIMVIMTYAIFGQSRGGSHNDYFDKSKDFFQLSSDLRFPGLIGLRCKKGQFSRPQPGCRLPNSPWPGIVKLFPARESLFSDVLAGDGKTVNLFYSVAYRFLYQG
jgi:hypothetical protein